MLEKGDLKKYAIVVLILIGLAGVLLFFGGRSTGYAVYEQENQIEFDLGTYVNTTYNGSAVVLVGENLTGTYTSQIFDAGDDAVWNNLSWVGGIKNSSNSFLIMAMHLGLNVSQVFVLDGTYYLADMKDSSKNFYINFSENLVNGTVLKVYSKKNKGIIVGIYSQSDVLGTNPLGTFTVNSLTGAWYNITLNISSPINAIWIGEGTGSGTDPKEEFDYIYAEIPGTNLTFYARSCDDVACSGESWTDISDTSPQDLSLNNNRYFQYKVAFASQDISITPSLSFVSIDYSLINTAPIIIITSPQNSQSFSIRGTINLNFTASDSDGNLQSCWYNIDNGNNVSLLNCANRTISASAIGTGSHTIIIYANDSLGLVSNDSVSFSITNDAPIILIASPQEGTTYGYNESLALDYSVSDADNNLQSCWYNIDNENNVSLAGCLNTTFDIAGNGDYNLNIYANDSLGLVASDFVSFSVIIGSPTIILNSPIDNYLNNGQNIEFSYTPTDIDLDYCELWGDFAGGFSLNQTDAFPNSGVENIFNLNLNDGIYLWNIKCVDDIGNSAFNGNKTFYVDTIAPDLSLTEPNGAKTSRTVSAIWSVSDASPTNCLYNVYQGASLEIANTSIDCSANSASFDVTVDASFVFNFYVNDSAGNANFATSSFSVDTSTVVSPPSSSGGGGGSYVLPNQTGKLQVSLIGNIIASPGENKKIPLTVKNIGKIFLNKCRLIAKEDISSWIYSINVEGIAPGQGVDFVFDLNVPEEIISEVNMGSLEIKCEEASNIQNISVSIPKEFSLIEIKDIKQEENILKITYVLDSSKFVGENIDVEIWLSNENGTELMRIVDKSPINKDGLIERNIEMQLPENLEGGVYLLNFAFSNDINNFIKKPVVLGITGKAVLDSEKGKLWVYILFLVILGIASFFIWRSHNKTDKTKKQKNNVFHKPNWLLRKKK